MKIHKDSCNRLRNIVSNADSDKLKQALEKLKFNFLELVKTAKSINKNPESLALFNFLMASIPYIDLALLNYNCHIQNLAFCARNLYEIHLWVQYIQKNESHLQEWHMEAEKDKFDILECCLELTNLAPNFFKAEHCDIKNEKIRRAELLEDINKFPKRNKRVSDIAEFLDKQEEQKFLFKFFSKLTHPTSYLVNSQPEIQNQPIRNMLLAYIQLYAWDIYDNIRIVLDPKYTIKHRDYLQSTEELTTY